MQAVASGRQMRYGFRKIPEKLWGSGRRNCEEETHPAGLPSPDRGQDDGQASRWLLFNTALTFSTLFLNSWSDADMTAFDL